MDTLQLTKELVSFQTPSHTSNRDVSLFIADKLTTLGFKIELVEYSDEGVSKFNVLAKREPVAMSTRPVGTTALESGSQRGLAYFCHSDVVPAEIWTGPGSAFSATEWDASPPEDVTATEPASGAQTTRRLYGRGTCDMKGSAACMLSALARLGDATLREPIYFVCTADEEVSYKGAKQVTARSEMYREMVQRQSRVIIGEPTELQVVHAHKGICKLSVVSHGEAAHSATDEGLNANLAMIPFLQELKSIHDETESNSAWTNPEFLPPSLSMNIGLNDHTKAINVKPARSVCTIFYRPLPGIDDQPLIQQVEAAANRHGLEFRSHGRVDAVYTDPNSSFVKEALTLTGSDRSHTVSYGTDAGELVALQDKIICGPGSIAQAHTTDEWIDLTQLTAGTALYEAFVRYWCVATTNDNS